MTVYGNGSTTKPKVSSPYGPRSGGAYDFHYGTDFIGYTDLKATDDGVVTYAGNRGTAAGYQVAYDIPEKGPNGETITIVRSHIKAGTIKVKVGQKIKQGQSIGTMGSTGNASGACDHIEVRYWPKGASTPKYQEPEAWFAARVGKGSGTGGGALKGTQRRAVAQVNGRGDPSTKHAPVGTPLAKGVVGNFVGWKRGEKVENNDVWFQGTSGRWFWSGGFEGGAKTTGLKDLNPPAAKTATRTVVSNASANARTSPTKAAAIDQARSLAPKTVGTFDAWTHGQKVSGNDVWFRGAFSGRWYWSGGFTSKSTTGLKQV